MGFIRGALAVIFGSLLFISILAGALVFTLSSSLKYENVKVQLSPVIRGFTTGDLGITPKLESQFSMMKTYCVKNSEYEFKYGDFVLSIPCSVIMEGTQAVVDYGIEKAIEEVYYKEYDCGFMDCFKQGEIPLFIISQKSRDYFSQKFSVLLLASAVLAVLMFFIVQKKTGFPIMIGSFFIIASLIVWKLGGLIAGLSNENTRAVINVFFSSSYSVFIKMLIAGIVLVVFGVVLKFAKIGMKISGFISKAREKKKEEKKKHEKQVLKKKKSK